MTFGSPPKQTLPLDVKLTHNHTEVPGGGGGGVLVDVCFLFCYSISVKDCTCDR